MDLITFLKTHTKINNEFIDDFFGLYESKDKYNFSINIQKKRCLHSGISSGSSGISSGSSGSSGISSGSSDFFAF